ncbi:MAG: GatB/YqeY domain-containing protein [Lysobacterales bacterium]
MSQLKSRLSEDMKAAMKAGDKDRLGVIRLINAAIKQREVDERVALDDTQVLNVLEKMLKQRRDSISQFEAAGRGDLAAIEQFELGVIEHYLPSQLAAEEVQRLIAAAIVESAASSPRDMGRVIALLKSQVAGRADMGQVSALVKERLAALG